jgi:hypothetical protein
MSMTILFVARTSFARIVQGSVNHETRLDDTIGRNPSALTEDGKESLVGGLQ